MPRGLKLGLGIPMVLVGFFVTLAGIAATVVFGMDGTFRIGSGVDSAGHAVVFDALSLRGLRGSGSWKADVTIEVDADDEEEHALFVGVGPRADVEAYLADAVVDRVVQLRPLGGIRTERAPGPAVRRDPGPPADQPFWAASAEGDPAALHWTATSGDWSVVVMRADGLQGVHGDGDLGLHIDAFGPVSVALVVVGVLLLLGGGALTVSGAKMPRRARGQPAPARPDPLPASP
jgi:hypothetical protein